jgi:hypothetical protein
MRRSQGRDHIAARPENDVRTGAYPENTDYFFTMQKEADRLKLIEKKFYRQALARAMMEELHETDEMRVEMQEFASMMKARAAQYCPKPSAEKMKWFECLKQGVIEFAENCHLDVCMSVNQNYIGSIVFETSYMELSSFDDPVISKFWIFLCQHGQLTIAQKEEVFSMEFRFDLRAR